MKRFVYNGRNSWKYFSKKEMRENYPDMRYKISGEVTRKKGKNTIHDLKRAGKMLSVQPVDTYKKPIYRICGFIPDNDEDTYIIVKKVNLRRALLPLLFVALLAVGIFLFTGESDSFLDKSAKPFDTQIKREEDLGESKILLPGFETLYMDEGKNELYVALANPKGNPCYFRYTIYMEGRDKEIYQSGMIKPGDAVTTVKMPEKMKKGTYQLTLKIQSFSLNNYKTELNGGEMMANLIVLSR